MKKYLLLTTAVVFMSSNVRATEYVPCGSESNCWPCGTACSARLDDKGTLTFSGEGGMSGYNSRNVAPWCIKEVSSKVKKVVIDEGITSVGTQILRYGNYTNLTEIILPESIQTIGGWGVSGGPNVAAIVIPENAKPAGNSFEDLGSTILFCAEGKESVCLKGSRDPDTLKIGSYKTNEDGQREYWYDENGLRGYYDAKGGLLKSVAKNDDGSVYTYDKNGKLISISGKKIYTVEEAEAVTAHGDKFHVGLTYK